MRKIVIACITAGFVLVASPAVAVTPQPVPHVLSWTGWHRCSFIPLIQWEDYRVEIDRIGDTAKEYRVQIKGPEPVDFAELYESRDGVFYYTGGYAGPATGNWTSPVTQLPYLKPGSASRWAHIRLHRTNGAGVTHYCHSHLDM